jgi:hypothetical protein
VSDEGLDEPACRVCGCTDEAACEGGCWWVPDPYLEGDLCSACLDHVVPADLTLAEAFE